MKHSIKWHRECLKNSMAHANSVLDEVERKREDYERLKKQNVFYASQINAAVIKGYDGFDDSRFMIERRMKS